MYFHISTSLSPHECKSIRYLRKIDISVQIQKYINYTQNMALDIHVLQHIHFERKLWLHYIQLKFFYITTCAQWNVRHHNVLLSDLVRHILNKIVTTIYKCCITYIKKHTLPLNIHNVRRSNKHGTNFVIILTRHNLVIHYLSTNSSQLMRSGSFFYIILYKFFIGRFMSSK